MVKVPASLADQIRKLATQEQRSVSGLVRHIITKAIAKSADDEGRER